MKPSRQRFVAEYLIDMNSGLAALRAGYPSAESGTRLLQASQVRKAVNRALADRNHRLQLNADDVLRTLWGMVQDLSGASLKQLFLDDGTIKPPSEWPDAFSKYLITGFEVEDVFERSHDGAINDSEGRTSWDKRGRVTKVKITDRVAALTKLIELVGRHVNVKAFEQPQMAVHNHLHVHESVDKEIADGRRRAAQRRIGNGQ